MSDLDELNLEKLSELATGGTDHFKQEVNQMDLSLQDLRALKKAEASGKNREKVLDFLDTQITTENVAAYLGIAEDDIGELGDLINEVERLEDVQHFEEKEIEIDQENLIDLVGGTVDEMKEFIDEKPLTGEQIENVLEAEKRVKDRKTAKKYLERKIKERSVGEDVEKAREDLETLKEDLQEVKTDEGIEDKDETGGADEETEKEVEENSTEEKDEEESQEEESSENESESYDQNKGKEQSVKEGDGEASDSEEEVEGSSQDNLEEKEQIAEELDLDMNEDELKAFSLKDLKKIRAEKRHREDLIEKLENKGMDDSELRNSSTDDLEKIVSSLGNKEDSEDKEDETAEDKEAQEEHEEMREEAEEDLEMLMGAVKKDAGGSGEDSGRNTREKIEDLRQSIKQKLNRSNKSREETSSGINADKVQEILDQYRNLDDDEASIKTAHIMKGFLEQSLGIERELTYKELAENMPEDNDSMEELADFFLKMHREQYTGKFNVEDSEELIDTSEEVISQFS